jgi:tetratricopeptide (TPR) repeat protein
MPEGDQISKVKLAIESAIESEKWDQVDALYCHLNGLEERSAEDIRKHALAVQNDGDLARAATMLRRAIRMDPDQVDAIIQLGSVYLAQQRHSEAEVAFREALDIDPDSVYSIRHLVQCVQHRPDAHDQSLKLLKHALEIDPEDAAIWIQLASVYGNNSETYDKSDDAFKRGLEIAPNSPSALHNYGQLKRVRGDLDGAVELLLRANELQPNDSNYAFSLALCYLFREELDLAMEWLNKATEFSPGNNAARVYTAFVLFLQGKTHEGWEQYEARLDLNEFKGLNYGRPRWDGNDLEGQPILLLREQGMGDNIQFIRYAKQVAARGGKVVVFAWEQLETLFSTVEGVSVITKGVPEPKHFHRYCPLLSLPYILGDNKDAVPDGKPYMNAPPELIASWREKIEAHPGYRVGLVWRGNSKHVNDRFRSSSMKEMTQLLSVTDASFFSLMKDRPDHEVELPEGIVELGSEFNNFTDTAAAMECLDLIISVDTSVCHLAGAIGKPVWTMLAKGPDFRWGIEGDKTPWYNSMTLYRQKKLGVWDDVYERMTSDLQSLVAQT